MFAFGSVQPIVAAVMFPTLDADLAFNQTPAAGKIGIAFGKGPNAMQLIGQQHPSINVERFLLANRADRFTCTASSHKISWSRKATTVKK